MFVHMIPLRELKAHSVTYWQPGRDNSAQDDTWLVLSELESGYKATVIEISDEDVITPEDALERFLRGESKDPARN